MSNTKDEYIKSLEFALSLRPKTSDFLRTLLYTLECAEELKDEQLEDNLIFQKLTKLHREFHEAGD